MPETWNTQELREMLIRGDENLPALQDAGLIDQTSLDVLLRTKKYHPDGLESDLAQNILERATSLGVNEAVQSGDPIKIAHASGRSNNKTVVNTSEWNKYEAIKDLFRGDMPSVTNWRNNVFQTVIFSSEVPPTGVGKSNTAYTLIEMGMKVRPHMNVITNNPSDEYEDTPEDWKDLKQLIMDKDGWSLVMLDEAAQFLQYADRSAGKSVSQLMKLLRHHKCHLILVAHTGADTPADIRRQMFFLDKKDKKTGVLGYGLKDGEGDRMEVQEQLITLESISETDTTYKSQGEKTININFDDNGSDDVKLCEGITNDGKECPAEATYPSDNPRVCVNHRNQISEALEDDVESNEEEYGMCQHSGCNVMIGLNDEGYCSRHR